MKPVTGLLRLTRPVNVLICGLSVVVGGSLGSPPMDRLGEMLSTLSSTGAGNLPPWQWRTLLAALSASLILAAGNVYNDIRDIACDRINAPERPLPAGLVPEWTAALFAGVLGIAGVIASVPLGTSAIVIAMGALVLLSWYDISLKSIPPAGNLSVAFLGGLAFFYGGIAGFSPGEALVPAAFAFLYHLGREIIKDAADLPGDRAAGIRTIATVRGLRVAGQAASASFLLLGILTLVPFAAGMVGAAYVLAMVILVFPVLAWCIIRIPRADSPEQFRRLAVILKAGMPLGILAVLIGFQW